MNHHRFIYRVLSSLFLVAAVAMIAGCGGSEPEPAQEVVRTPRPTFTPTPLQPTNTPVPVAPAPDTGAAPAGAAAPAAGDAAEGTQAIAVVNDDEVNVRSGPGTNESILAMVGRGTQYDLVGKNPEEDWWQVCCVDGATGWIFYAYVDTSGPVDGVPVIGAPPQPEATQPPPTVAPAPVAQQPAATSASPAPPVAATEAPAPTVPAAPAFPFNLAAQEQFPESNNVVRIFLNVTQGNQALAGYTVRVKHDGAELPVTATSSDSAGFTWPVANPRQRFQNMKVEFPNVQPGGVWEVTLIDGGGGIAGPTANFTLTASDTNRELYVRYEKP